MLRTRGNTNATAAKLGQAPFSAAAFGPRAGETLPHEGHVLSLHTESTHAEQQPKQQAAPTLLPTIICRLLSNALALAGVDRYACPCAQR